MWVYFLSKPAKPVEAQSNKMIGETNIGTVYIDTDTIETVKDGHFYLIVSAEEH